MNRGNISFSHTEGRVWARASERHNVLFMKLGKTVREGCWWSGKWRTAIARTKLTALPGQPQFLLNQWPIFSSQRKEKEGERGEKKKAPHLCCLALAEVTCLSLALLIKDCILVWRTEEGVLMIDTELLLLPCCLLLLPAGGVTGGGREVVRRERHLVRKGYRT